MNPKPRNFAEDLDHPLYEMEMMHEAALLLPKATPGPNKNAILESFIVHARALDEFFSMTICVPPILFRDLMHQQVARIWCE